MLQPPAETPRHTYYLLGETVPIKVSFNAMGHPLSTEVPGRTTGGLRLDVRYLGRIERSFEIDEIDAAEFADRYQQVWAKL